ncbi:hypothetical protein B0H10DRAFT_1948122 [Mycena sp. CBHHK59/15]|nr:hypothetical protein B0H10DRAFT_1948122 [Mycena sp. CBHHK59/15]
MFEGIQQGLKDTDSMVAVHDSNSDVIVHDSNSDVGTIIVSDSDNDNLLDLQYPPSLPSVMPPITLDLCVDVAVAFWAHEIYLKRAQQQLYWPQYTRSLIVDPPFGPQSYVMIQRDSEQFWEFL